MVEPKKSRRSIVPESLIGVCLWKIPETHSTGGGFIADSDKNYLSLEGVVGDRRVEGKMRQAAKYWTGEDVGEPHWIRGSRQITDAEADEMQERLENGLIPDWEEASRLATENLRNES